MIYNIPSTANIPLGGHCSQGTVSMAVDPSPLLLPNTSGILAVLGMLYIMYVG